MAPWFHANRHVLDSFARHPHEQGPSGRLLRPEALFAPETLEAFKFELEGAPPLLSASGRMIGRPALPKCRVCTAQPDAFIGREADII